MRDGDISKTFGCIFKSKSVLERSEEILARSQRENNHKRTEDTQNISEEGPSRFIELHVVIVCLCWHLQRANEWVRVRRGKLGYDALRR